MSNDRAATKRTPATEVSESGNGDVANAGFPNVPSERMGRLLSGYLILIACGAAIGILGLWPDASAVQAVGSKPPTLPVLHLHLTTDVTQLILAMLAGLIGATTHAMTLMAKRNLSPGHTEHSAIWFVFTPLVGAAVALIFYATIRAGLLTTSSAGDTVSLYGVVALGGIAGLFSRKVMNKLAEILGGIGEPKPAPQSGDRPIKPEPKQINRRNGHAPEPAAETPPAGSQK